MNEDNKTVLIITIGIIIFIMIIMLSLIIDQKMTYQYCMNTPLDRINKERCGL